MFREINQINFKIFFWKKRGKMQKIGQKGFAGEKKCLNLEFEYEHQALPGA